MLGAFLTPILWHFFNGIAASGFRTWLDIGWHKIWIWKRFWWYSSINWWGLSSFSIYTVLVVTQLHPINICVHDCLLKIHTPDSSRYWIANSYEERFKNGLEPQNIDKVNFYLLRVQKLSTHSMFVFTLPARRRGSLFHIQSVSFILLGVFEVVVQRSLQSIRGQGKLHKCQSFFCWFYFILCWKTSSYLKPDIALLFFRFSLMLLWS